MSQATLLAPESLPPFEPERALATLEWLRRQSPDEQRATFEYWQRALGETANGGSATPALQPAESPNHYGAPLPPFDPARAIAFLESVYEGDGEEQRETFEYLKHALNETRAANGEGLLFSEETDAPSESAAQPVQPNAYGAPLPVFNPERALAALDWLCQQDTEEQRETYEYLKRALNETRAANGERLHFPVESDG